MHSRMSALDLVLSTSGSTTSSTVRAGVEHVRTPLMPEGDEMRPLFDKIGARRWRRRHFLSISACPGRFFVSPEARFTTAEARSPAASPLMTCSKGSHSAPAEMFWLPYEGTKDAYEVLGFKSQTYRGLRVFLRHEHLTICGAITNRVTSSLHQFDLIRLVKGP